MIVTVYIDESGTHESGFTILGGWVGRLGQWATFNLKWKALLKRSHLTYFHSKRMRSTKGEFSDWKVVQKRAFMNEAATLALKNLEFGFTIVMKDDDYSRLYLADGRPKGVTLDSRYGLCFRHCLSLVPRHVAEAFDKSDNLRIHFVMESGHKNYGDAERIFNRVKNSNEPHEQEVAKTLVCITRADNKDFPGLQVADVNAYSTYQHVTRSPVDLVQLDPGESMRAAKKIQKVPIFHFPIGKDEIGAYRQFISDEQKEKQDRKLFRLARLSNPKDAV